MYDTNTKVWSVFTNMGAHGIERKWSVALSVGTYGYISTGYDSLGNSLNDLWQYAPINEGVNEISASASNVTLYPNPNNGVFQLTIRNYELGITNTVEVYNLLGEKVYSSKLNGYNTQLNLCNNSNGIYLYRVLTETGDLVSEGKFIIQK